MPRPLAASLLLLPLALVLSLSSPALAVDGVLEINQACAEQTGCFSGDGAAFPVTIKSPGSYRLTGNLDIQVAGVTAILVDADDVMIDLGGFTIQGPVTCMDTPVTSCSNGGAGRGIEVQDTAVSNLTVRNGTIAGMPGGGVQTGPLGTVDNIVARENGSIGIEIAADEGRVLECSAERNGDDGIVTRTEGTVVSNRSYGNALRGIEVLSQSLIRDNVVAFNGGTGIDAQAASLIQQNVINQNNQISDSFSGGLRVRNDNRVFGNTLDGNFVRGILASNGDTIYDSNHVTDSPIGIEFSAGGNAYRNNTTAGSATPFGGISIGTTTDLGGNVGF